MHKISKLRPIVLIAGVVCLGLFFVKGQTNPFRHALDDLLFDNKNHYLPCDRLPEKGQVMQIVQEHQAVIQTIAQVHPGFVGVEIDTATCPGKADLLIWYASHEDRTAIEKMIGGDTFLGIPYRLNNR